MPRWNKPYRENGFKDKSLLEKIRIIIDNSHNGYTFRYRCKGQHIIIEKLPDGLVVAYYDDDRDGQIEIDLDEPPFDRLKYFLVNE